MKILVTGGCGFIGSHLVERLANDGHEVIVIDNLSTGTMGNLGALVNSPNVHLVTQSILQYLRPQIFDGVDCIFHLAAIASVTKSIEAPLYTIDTNIMGTARILDYAKSSGVKKVIFASSSAVYGNGALFADSEQGAFIRPLNPYGISKMTGEQFMDFYHWQHGIETINLRLFNVYGPRQNPSYAPVIPIFIGKALKGEDLPIYGDGNQQRDFIYVKDVVEVFVRAMNCDRKLGVYNIGTGYGIKINTLAGKIISMAGSSLQSRAVHLPERNGDVRESIAYVGDAIQYFNFRARIQIDDGLMETIDYFRSKYVASNKNSGH